jgi:hypothetical protein
MDRVVRLAGAGGDTAEDSEPGMVIAMPAFVRLGGEVFHRDKERRAS